MAGRASVNACESKVGKAYALLAQAEEKAVEAGPAPDYLRRARRFDDFADYEDSVARAERHIYSARAQLDEALKWLRGASNALDRSGR